MMRPKPTWNNALAVAGIPRFARYCRQRRIARERERDGILGLHSLVLMDVTA